MNHFRPKSLSLGMAFLLLAACVSVSVVRSDAEPTASAAAQDFETALRQDDYFAVRQIASDGHRSQAERDLANAALASWLMRDEQAGQALTRSAANTALPENLRRRASLMLSGLRLRQGRYAEADALIAAALPGITDERERTDLQQTLTLSTPLANVAPMQVTVDGPGTITLTRDATSHMRTPVVINGGTLDAIVDSGSGISSITVGNARRLGLRQIAGNAVIGTATSTNLTTGLAVADQLSIGEVQYRNVVFIVVPDEQFVFANGAYVVQGIIGLPLMMPLGRLEFQNHGATETLHYARTNGTPSAASNLNVEAVQVYAYARVPGSDRQARFFIDDGAPATHVNARFPTAFPAAAANGQRQAVTVNGGAGSETQDSMVLPSLTLTFGQTAVPLSGIRVFDDHQTDRDGDIGLDVMHSAGGYVLDFDAMRFELLPSR